MFLFSCAQVFEDQSFRGSVKKVEKAIKKLCNLELRQKAWSSVKIFFTHDFLKKLQNKRTGRVYHFPLKTFSFVRIQKTASECLALRAQRILSTQTSKVFHQRLKSDNSTLEGVKR